MNAPPKTAAYRKPLVNTILASILLLAVTSQAWAETVSVYGPRTFTKGKGVPETYSDVFPPAEGVGALQLIVSSKGAQKGSVGKITVSLNGVAIIGPSDLQPNGVSRKTIRYGLQPLNTLEVAFHDLEKTVVTIEVVGETEEHLLLDQPAGPTL